MKNCKLLLGYPLLLGLILLGGCEDHYSDLKGDELKQLEEKYHVKIDNTRDLTLNKDDLLLIEENIISLKNKFKAISSENVELIHEDNGLKTKVIEGFELSTWAFNLS